MTCSRSFFLLVSRSQTAGTLLGGGGEGERDSAEHCV